MLPSVSVRQFAKLDGCSHTLVQKAIREGKLPVSAEGKLDPALAGSDWRKQNRGGNSSGNTAKVATPISAAAPVATRGKRKVATPPADTVEPIDLGDEDFIAQVLAGRYRLTGEAERVKENALAAVRLLEARRAADDVVDLEVAETILFDLARSLRDAWLNWPSRVAPLIAAKLGIAVEPLLEALNDHVGQHLSQLGEPEADFAATN